MPDFNSQIVQINTDRQAFDTLQKQLYALRVREQKGEKIETAVIKKAQDQLSAAKAKLQGSITTLHQGQTQDTLVSNWDADMPLMLMPVRIQTRIKTTQNPAAPTPFELLIRIYPDDILMCNHEAGLLESEVAAGKKYWNDIRLAEQPNIPKEQQLTLKKEAWRQLCSQLSGGRSLYISRKTTPLNRTNLGQLTNETDIQFDNNILNETKNRAWSEAAQTRLLPDRFQAIVFRTQEQGAVPFIFQDGNLIPDTLQIGLDPMNDSGNIKKKNGEIIVGSEVKWMTDFAEAERVGMGIRIAIPPAFFPSFLPPQPQIRAGYLSAVGIPRIVVVGVLHSADKMQSKALLQELFDNHLYSSKGMSFLKKGTPTNNTDDNNAAWSIFNDPLSNFYFDGYKAYNETETTADGVRLAQALGIAKTGFSATPYAEKQDIAVEKMVNSSLYAATIGYFFDHLLNGVITNRTELKAFFNNYVLGGGSMPSIRIGNQPYGVVLAGEYAKYAQTDANAAFYQGLLRVLTNLDSVVWQPLADKTPRVGKGDDPAKTLTDVLSLHAHSVSFSQQWFYPINLTDREIKDFAKSQNANRAFIFDFLKSLGYQGLAAPFIGSLVQDRSNVTKPLNQSNLVKPELFDEDDPLSSTDNFNYFQWLSNGVTLRDLEVLPVGSRANVGSLLFMIARQAYLNLLSSAVLSFIKLPIFKQTENLKITTLVRGMQAVIHNAHFNTVAGGTQSPTVWGLLNTIIELDEQHAAIGADLANSVKNKPIGDVIQSEKLVNSVLRFFIPQGATNPLIQNTIRPVMDFMGQRTRLKFLADIPAATLQLALINHLDAVTYRLDAWQEGILNKKLEQNRSKAGKGEGIYIGAYGWVEDLKLTPNRVENSGGVIHAPSVTHATTAAIMKAAFINHKNAGGQSVFALNLHSQRVQRAQEILEKMRAGERLEAILGYQFERDLQDISIKNNNAAAGFILDFRKTYPITALQVPPNANAPAVEVVMTQNVTNGLAIAEEFLRTDVPNAKTVWRTKIPVPDTITINFIQTAVNNTADTLDAVKDLLMTETAYRMAQGNFSAAGATLDGLKKGNVPHELGFLQPARQNALQFANRLTIHFETEGAAAAIDGSPRNAAEGGLNRWCLQLLGKMNTIGCTIRHILENSEESPISKWTLADLKIQPIDMVCLMRTPAELEARLIYAYRQKKNISDDLEIRLNLADSGANTIKPLAAMLPIAQLAQRIITSARPLTALDYLPNGANESATAIDTVEYRARLDIFIKNLTNIIAAIKTLPVTQQVVLPEGGGTVTRLRDVFKAIKQTKYDATVEAWLLPNYTDASSLQTRLIQVSNYGVADAFPQYADAKNPVAILALVRQADAVVSATERKLADITAALNNLPNLAESPLAHIEGLMDIGKQLFNGSMPLLPRFNYSNAAQINESNSRQIELLKGASTDMTPPQLKAEEWLQSTARVRPKLAQWETLRFMTATNNDFNTDLSPVQVPLDALLQKQADGTTKPIYTWLGAEFTEGVFARRDVVSIVTTGAMAAQTAKLQTGILIDEWVETIPTDEELTALAFHFNQPNAEAPQALLLAVCPEAKWTWNAVVMSVLETLRRAKLRTVNLNTIKTAAKAPNANNMLKGVAQLLPMTIAPVNVQQHTFSLDYGMMDEAERQRMSAITGDGLGHYQIWQE